MVLVHIINNINNVGSGILDNDKNGDGIPDFIYPMREIQLKVKVFESVHKFHHYMNNDTIYEKSTLGLCFGITLDENLDFTFHYEDSTSYFDRTQNNIPSMKSPGFD
jgi:hypothetical protein